MQISLADFRKDIASYHRFVVSKTDVFLPVDISATFDRAYVCLSASPYICFAADQVQITVKHIKGISRQCGNSAGKSYIFTCQDYSDGDNTITFKVDCFGI